MSWFASLIITGVIVYAYQLPPDVKAMLDRHPLLLWADLIALYAAVEVAIGFVAAALGLD